MRRAFPWEPQPSPGERLAEKKAEAINPALAIKRRAATESQERDRLARAAETRHHQHHHHQREQDMAKEGTADALAGTEGAQRRAAEERARLERDGKLAAKLSDSIEAPSAAPRQDGREIADRTAGKPGAENVPAKTDQERRVEEARERIRASREKEREDREQGKSRGRGR